MNTPLQDQWFKKSRFLTQALILSGALNIGLLASFFYFVTREKKNQVAYDLQPIQKNEKRLSNDQVLAQFAEMSYPELVDLLENQEVIEGGYKKRDLALASLVTFHSVHLDRALQGAVLSKRKVLFQRKDGPEQVEVTLYPGLTEDQFQAFIHFIKTEKFPFTAQGLFYELQHSTARDTSLLETFYLTPEFTILMTLFTRANIPLPPALVIDLISQGDFDILHQFREDQKKGQDLSPLRLKLLLLNYIKARSTLAAKILLEWDRDFILKQFEDPDLMTFIDLFPQKTPTLEQFLKEVLTSPRSDAIWKKAAEKLYLFSQKSLPPSYDPPYDHPPYDHQGALETFVAPQPPKSPSKKTHIVQAGENLWKIARKHKVSVDALRKANNLETDKLKVGKQLVIP